MKEKRNKCIAWIKEHKAELVIAGVSVGAIIVIILGIKNYSELEEKWTLLRKTVEKVPEKVEAVETGSKCEELFGAIKECATRVAHDVNPHMRNLAEGHKASAKQIAAAKEYGIELPEGKTWVNPYRTGGLAA